MSLFKKVVETKKDKFNKTILEGLATKTLPDLPEFMHRIILSGMEGIKKEIPFRYLGYRRLSPVEEFWYQFNGVGKDIPAGKNKIDIAKSTLYKVEYVFEYDGEPVKRIILLPYAEKGGVITLSGAVYAVSPVLTEYVISSINGEVFVRLMKDKLIFKRIDRNIVVDGIKKPAQIIVTRLYKFNNNTYDKVPVALMLFVKEGFRGVFKKYFGTDDVKVTLGEVSEKIKRNIQYLSLPE
jgi:hypothetical protein